MFELTIPLAGSCRSADTDYDPVIARLGSRFDVLLDGAPVRYVVSYNCHEGSIRCIEADEFGRKRFLGKSPWVNELVLRGEVTVRWS